MADSDYGVGAMTAATNAMVGALSVSEQKKANQQNYDIALKNLGLSEEQMKYMRELQERMFERDDTAISRMVKDLENNGFNKLLALGTGGFGSTSVSMPSAPQIDYRYKPIDYSALKQNLLSTVVDIENLKNIRSQRSLMETQEYGQTLTNILTQLKAQEDAYNFDFYKSKGLPTNASGVPKVVGQFEGMIGNSVTSAKDYVDNLLKEAEKKREQKATERRYDKAHKPMSSFKRFINSLTGKPNTSVNSSGFSNMPGKF